MPAHSGLNGDLAVPAQIGLNAPSYIASPCIGRGRASGAGEGPKVLSSFCAFSLLSSRAESAQPRDPGSSSFAACPCHLPVRKRPLFTSPAASTRYLTPVSPAQNTQCDRPDSGSSGGDDPPLQRPRQAGFIAWSLALILALFFVLIIGVVHQNEDTLKPIKSSTERRLMRQPRFIPVLDVAKYIKKSLISLELSSFCQPASILTTTIFGNSKTGFSGFKSFFLERSALLTVGRSGLFNSDFNGYCRIGIESNGAVALTNSCLSTPPINDSHETRQHRSLQNLSYWWNAPYLNPRPLLRYQSAPADLGLATDLDQLPRSEEGIQRANNEQSLLNFEGSETTQQRPRGVIGTILFLLSFILVTYGLDQFDDVRLLGLNRRQKIFGLMLALVGGVGLYCGLSFILCGAILL